MGYASLLMLVVSQQLSILLAVLAAFKCLPEVGLQWFTMGRLYYVFFRSSSLILAIMLAFMYLRTKRHEFFSIGVGSTTDTARFGKGCHRVVRARWFGCLDLPFNVHSIYL